MSEAATLWSLATRAGTAGRRIDQAGEAARLDEVARATASDRLRGASVLLRSADQLPAALALLALDGVARRIVLCPPEVGADQLPAMAAQAEADAVVSDDWTDAVPGLPTIDVEDCHGAPAAGSHETEWVLSTSGTSGQPKLVAHTLATLTGPLAEGPSPDPAATWATFYDIRRYGGLQVLLRALLGGGSLVLSQGGEGAGAFLARAAKAGATHVLGTPTHWRRALMTAENAALRPRYVRLSGEVADQAILDRLAATYPDAAITHAYASTEAGVGFEVTDGREGFPAGVLGRHGEREIRVEGGSLRIRSDRQALRYLDGSPLADADGWVDTGDMVEERDGRFRFAGRRSGVINVGGNKVHPEEVEAVVNRHPAVRMAQVRGRRSPLTGMLVVADVVLRPGADGAAVEREVLAACRAALAPHKVPAFVRPVSGIDVAASGKIGRADA